MTTDATTLRAREQDKICSLMVSGLSLHKVCKLRDMPSLSTVMRWLREDPAFAQQYALARESQADTLADRIIDLADKVTPWSANADRVRIDALKWVASKLKPRRYGDRVELGLPPPAPVVERTQLEGARRWAFREAREAYIKRQQGMAREPLLLEGYAVVEPEPVPVFREVDRRPKPAPDAAPDPLRVLAERARDLEREREENMHVTAGERGTGNRSQPRVILGRRPFTGGER